MQEEVNVMKSLSRACIISSIVGTSYVVFSLYQDKEVIDSVFIALCLIIFGVCLKEE